MSLNDELRSGGRIDEPLDERSPFGGAAEGTSESKIRSLGGIEPVLLPPPPPEPPRLLPMPTRPFGRRSREARPFSGELVFSLRSGGARTGGEFEEEGGEVPKLDPPCDESSDVVCCANLLLPP